MIKPADLRGKRILISPLNWGMGHVSRCIGIIHQLREQQNALFIACDEQQRQIFEEYFEDVTFIAHTGYPFHFGGKGKFGWDLLLRSNALRKRLSREREEVQSIVKEYDIDIVVADHRYGFLSEVVPSIFVTHQVNLPVKWYEKGVDVLHQKLMRRFNYVWVLDDAASNLAGKLSENCPENGCYIGWYSRFSIYSETIEKNGGIVLIASGPEVYAEELIKRYMEKEKEVQPMTVIHSTSVQIPKLFSEISGSWRKQDEAIRKASKIISRSGYSTLMDCAFLMVENEYVPTDGQAEQEYLYERWRARKN